MNVTKQLRAQHVQIAELINDINGSLKVGWVSENSDKLRSQLAKLSGVLKIHLLMEDDHLYPLLMKSIDDDIAATAKRFKEEMGSLSDTFKGYSERWLRLKNIHDEAEDFVTETKAVFDALVKRVIREDNELYPLIEKEVVTGRTVGDPRGH